MTHAPPLDPMPPQMVVPLAFLIEADNSWRRPLRLLLILSILYAAASIVWKGLWFISLFGSIMGVGMASGHWLAVVYVIAMVGSVGSSGIAIAVAILCLRGSDLRRPLCVLMLIGVACVLAGSVAQALYLVMNYSMSSGYANLAMASIGVLCQGMFPLAVTLLLWPRRDDPFKGLFGRASG